MQLAVLHYHFRPGGVRRVIETGLPVFAAAAGVSRVILAGGEAPDAAWRRQMEAALHPCAVEWLIEPALGYWSEQTLPVAAVRGGVREALSRMMSPGSVLWAHNLSVGRNMILSQEVGAVAQTGTVWLHHHDWWWDGRWERWPEMAGQGIASLEEALAATVPEGAGVRHFCINATDARRMQEWTGGDFHFLPNVVTPERVTPAEVDGARDFLRRVTDRHSWWLYPCRALRRKNLAEALLVQRLMAPDSVTVTTGGASSTREHECLSTLTTEAGHYRWPLFAGVCANVPCPPVAHLLAAADAVVVTSLREGFGLPYYEAAGRPLAARIPSGLEETLRATGFDFRNGWRELRVPRGAFDAESEAGRTAAGRHRLLEILPEPLHDMVEQWRPAQAATPDFGTLGLTAQLEVLRQPVVARREDWLMLNPGLRASLSPQPAASNPGSFREWAAAILNAARKPAETVLKGSWPGQARKFLAPLLEDWLRHPLLWDSTPALP